MRCRAHTKQKGPTYAEKLNVLRDAKQTECINLGLRVGMQLMLVAVNHTLHAANDRLLGCYKEAVKLWQEDFQNDPELAADRMVYTLEKLMGKDWQNRVDSL